MQVKHLFILSLAALICACTDKKGSSDGQVEPSENVDSILWRTDSLCIMKPIAQGENLCYQIELKLDTLAGESELAKNLAIVLRDSVLHMPKYTTIKETMRAFADSIEVDWKAELAESYEPGSEYNGTLQFSLTVEGGATETSSNNIISYIATTDCYLGGAHGSYEVRYYNFDKQSGKLLGIKDIVPADKEADVLKAMEEQLCKDWDAKDMADLRETTGITMLSDLYLTNNFLLKGDSIEFLFNQYDIAPYSAGLISITIPLPASR